MESFYFGISDKTPNLKEFNVSGFIASVTYKLMRVMRDGAETIKHDLQGAVRTWRTPVDFQIALDKRGDTFTMSVFTDSEIFKFVNDGTSVRYATMTPDFISKTRPGSMQSGRGRGGVAYVNKKIPRPGIQARNFIETAFEQHARFVGLRMENEFYRTLGEFWRKAL